MEDTRKKQVEILAVKYISFKISLDLSNSRIEMTGVRGLEDRTIDMIQFE
jgi:hypothetical protein